MFDVSMLEPMMLFPDRPVLSYIIIYMVASFVLWMAKDAFHKLMKRVLEELALLKQRIAQDLAGYAAKATERAKNLASEYFLRETERDIEKGHGKLAHRVEKGLSRFPEFQSEAMKLVSTVNKNFEHAKVPPTFKQHPSLTWLEDKIKTHTKAVGLTSDEAKHVGKKLRDIEKKMNKELSAHDKVRQQETTKRLKILSKQSRPINKLQTWIDKLVSKVSYVQKSVNDIDGKLKLYYQYREDDDMLLRAANQSILTRFFIALFFILIAVGGGTLNFFLIARPLSEIVGGSGLIMGMEVAQMGAVMIILLEVAAGVFFMETLGLSHLLPAIERWDPDVRKRVAIAAGVLLLGLAGVEAGLALLREMLVANDQATMNMLIGNEDGATAEAFAGWGPMAVQAVLGFVIPLVLALVALPMEILFHVTRIVFQYIWAGIVFLLSYAVQLISSLLLIVLNVILSFYDLLIFFWVLIEGWVKGFARFVSNRREARA